MEISEDEGEDTEVDANSEYDVWSQSGEHACLDNNGPDLEKILSPEEQGYPNSTFDYL